MTAASPAKRRSRRHFSWTLDFAMSLERLKSFLSDLVLRKMPSVAEPKACFSITAKKIPNKDGARTQPCFTPLLMSKVSDVEPLKTTVPFMSLRNDRMMLSNLGSTCHPGEDFEKAVCADKVEGLRQIYEGHEQWLPLFPAFFLQLPGREHNVDGRSCWL